MTSYTIRIQNKIGLHARPAVLLIETAKKYSCRLMITKDGKTTDLHSMISLLCMQIKMGDEVIISADGENENEAVQELVELINLKFGED
jgi:Phosphotransferase System HPr (HPr) Family